ncbi:transcription factor domain-containing protein [Aspergillus tanneri]|uniref:Zn(2)-C6 fungal-type domain-containing protein n=1 Tax=Aspergillus tanneri TaxID=1220188 RepID=A0A5M9N149_9EURO|nr:uncharacterized protein ATNIH1004_000886 [Aspergillus tanneri]KAA8651986.1 hypothetical protein ATNIH1004_000886 [Aspergillus tanneri]
MSLFGPPCNACRIKKRRCDRQRPVCGTCARAIKPTVCSYRTSLPQRSAKRVKTRHSVPIPMVVIDSDRSSALESSPPWFSQQSAESNAVDGPFRVREEKLPNIALHGDHQDDAIEVCSVASDQSFHTAIMSRGLPESSGYRDPQLPQLMGLEREVTARIDRMKEEDTIANTTTVNAAPTQQSIGSVEIQLPAIDDSRSQGFSVRLSPEEADRLMADYLTREYAYLPILDLSEFRALYAMVRSGQRMATGSSPFLGVLFTMFSLSALTTGKIDEAGVKSLFDHGRSLSRDLDDHGSPAQQVQSYILQTQYLYTSGKPHLAWIFIGLAIRYAQALGLQSRTESRDASRRRDRELSRRLWHSAMILERMLALQMGLPPQTSQPLRVPLPTHLDTDYVDAISEQTSSADVERPSLIEFLTACARLYSQVEDLLAWEDETRMRQDSCAAKKVLALDFKPLMQMDSYLYQWQTSIPSFLQKPKPNTQQEDPIIRRQRNLLRARYLYVRLRLHRPLLILGLGACVKCSCRSGDSPHITINESSPDLPLALSTVRVSSLKCIMAALELLDIFEHEKELFSPSWESVDYLYICGTVFLAAQSCPFKSSTSHGQPDLVEMEMSLSRVLMLLERYQSMQLSGQIYDIAQRCRRTLENLSGIVEGSDEAAVFGDHHPGRLLKRMRIYLPDPKCRDRNSQGDVSRLEFFSWMGSLPIDLDSGTE